MRGASLRSLEDPQDTNIQKMPYPKAGGADLPAHLAYDTCGPCASSYIFQSKLESAAAAARFQVVTDEGQLLGHGLARPRRTMGIVLQHMVLHRFTSRLRAVDK